MLTGIEERVGSLRIEMKLYWLGGIVVCLFPLPSVNRELRGLNEQRIPTLHLNRLRAAAGLHQHFQFDGAAQLHAAGRLWVLRHNLVDNLAGATVRTGRVLSGTRLRLETRQHGG